MPKSAGFVRESLEERNFGKAANRSNVSNLEVTMVSDNKDRVSRDTSLQGLKNPSSRSMFFAVSLQANGALPKSAASHRSDLGLTYARQTLMVQRLLHSSMGLDGQSCSIPKS
jgi:hypothetical protein